MNARPATGRRNVAVTVLALDAVALLAGVTVALIRPHAAPVPGVQVVTTQCVGGSIVNGVNDGGPGLLAVDTGVSC